MIMLEKVRLVNWHNFEDTIIDIGNRCLFAGDNGSGKSTVIDAIQYALAANLRMAKFNSAADERRGGGRDLMGYVRCKVGSETAEYRRGDTVSHIMLQWSGPVSGAIFSCGVCVEAYRDNHYAEHFWIGDKIEIENIAVRDSKNMPLEFRRFKNVLTEEKAGICETKKMYIRDLTNKLGVFKRQSEVNPYLDALTRSVGFKPLDSIGQFVCDYILDEKPVSIQDMKQNLENYKEAARQAKAAEEKIAVLKKICSKAEQWETYDELIIKHRFLKLKITKNTLSEQNERILRNISETQGKLEFVLRQIDDIGARRTDIEQALRSVQISLASNEAHRLYDEISGRIVRLKTELAKETEKAERYKTLKTQCEALIGRSLNISKNAVSDFDRESETLEEEAKKYQDASYTSRREKIEIEEKLQDAREELAGIEHGVHRWPREAQILKEAVQDAGINAFFLAEAAEITDPQWADAVEGWLNTRRFAVLVDPDDFQKSVRIYNSLPRSVAGAFLPNIEKMRRDAKVRQGSLAEIVKAEGYARVYLDYTLGRVIMADIESLKNYEASITKECMTYSHYSVSRIKEEVYSRHFLGRRALEERKKFLITEIAGLEKEAANAEKREMLAAEQEKHCRKVLYWLVQMKEIFSSLTAQSFLQNEIEKAQTELAAVDTASFRELEEKSRSYEEQIDDLKKDNDSAQKLSGSLQTKLAALKIDLENSILSLAEQEEELKHFSAEYPLQKEACEKYAAEKFAVQNAAELIGNYENTLKAYKQKCESIKKEYSALVRNYEAEFHYLLGMEPKENIEAETQLMRLKTSELPEYREKIERAYSDAEKEFKDHFIARLAEHIEEAKASFDEINDILRTLLFGRDRYRFHLEELSERRGQIEVIREAAKIPSAEDGLFAQIADPAAREAAQRLFDRILNSPLDSKELRDICDYRKYFNYDIIITETDTLDDNGAPVKLSLSKVLKEKSGGESQTPYYVAIAASFYRFYKSKPESAVRLVIFDEAFNRMDDERIGKILSFYQNLNLQIITSVPPEKIEAIAPFMDRINLITRFGSAVKVRECHKETL